MIIKPHKERKCQNNECEVVIPKEANPKKLFCSLVCKNRHHYERNGIDDFVFEKHKNQLKQNRNILSMYILEDIFKLKEDILEHIGFNRKAFMEIKRIAKVNGGYFKVYVIDGLCFWFKADYCYFNFLDTIEVEAGNRW